MQARLDNATMSDMFVRKPGDVFQDQLSDGGDGPEMVVIPPGTFMMGSPDSESERYDDEGPVHEVTIAREFALTRYPAALPTKRKNEYLYCGAPNPADTSSPRMPLADSGEQFVSFLQVAYVGTLLERAN